MGVIRKDHPHFFYSYSIKSVKTNKLLNRLIRHNPKSNITLKQFYEKRNTVLIVRETGGLGDILMHRMIFEDIKREFPECKLVFACPPSYHEAVKDHPFIDEIVDYREINQSEYVLVYNTTSACCRHELKMAPLSDKHRSDIWANHCGVELTNHDMHLTITDDEKKEAFATLSKLNKESKPKVLLCPVSAMASKNLLKHHLDAITDFLKDDYFVYAVNNKPIPAYDGIVLTNLTIRQWMALVAVADYVISVDTAAFHLASGLKKPLTGIFTWADGLVYGKYADFELVQKHRKDGNWECGPCYNWSNCPKTNSPLKPCLTELTSESIIRGIENMFKKWN